MHNLHTITIGLAHVNNTVGKFKGNTTTIKAMMEEMAKAQCSFALFPECAISGYSAEEVVLWPLFQESQLHYLKELVHVSGRHGNHQTVFVVGGTFEYEGQVYNVAYVLANGLLLGIVPKMSLPEYGIFFDKRVFGEGREGWYDAIPVPGFDYTVPFGDLVFTAGGIMFGVSVCEDIWTPWRIQHHVHAGAEVELNISASPFRSGIAQTRDEMLATRSGDNQAVLAYTSQVGGQGGIVYDGDGYIFAAGRLILRSPRWKEGWECATVSMDTVRAKRAADTTWRMDMERQDKIQPMNVPVHMSLMNGNPLPKAGSPFIPRGRSRRSEKNTYLEDIIEALIMGLGGYLEKTGAFDRVGVNSSGGRDSALVIAIAYLYAQRKFAHLEAQERTKAIKDFVHTFSLPTHYNSDETKSIARLLSEELGVNFAEVSIEEEYNRELALLASVHDPGWIPSRLTKQNLQSEIRAKFLSAWCGAHRACMLNTSNMTEKALGYGTKRGDMQGDFAIITNVPKTVVRELLAYLRRKYHWKFISDIELTKESAELEDGQSDESDLGPYIILDTIMKLEIGDKLGPVAVYQVLCTTFSHTELKKLRNGYTQDMLKIWVKGWYMRFWRNIHKWVTSPEGIHVGIIDLDRERALHLPTVMSLEWIESELTALENVPD